MRKTLPTYLCSLWLLLFTLPTQAGEFIYRYIQPDNPNLQETYEITKKLRLLETISAVWNERIKLPQSLLLLTEECKEANAYYDSAHNRLHLCYELIHQILAKGSDNETSEQLVERTYGVIMFVTAHEMGHAVIDMLELPVLGNEEVAADQFAVLSLLDQNNQWSTEKREMYWGLLASGITEFAMAEHGNHPLSHLRDIHLLSGQRFYNALCLMYGYDPAKNTRFIIALKDRAAQCPSEYQQIQKTWHTLLKPYLKTSPAS